MLTCDRRIVGAGEYFEYEGLTTHTNVSYGGLESLPGEKF